MTKKSQTSHSRSVAPAEAVPVAAEPHAVDEIIELNNKFAKAILEASESYLRAMSSAQEHLWSPLRLSQDLLDSAARDAEPTALDGTPETSDVQGGVQGDGSQPDNLVTLPVGENPGAKKSRIQRAWAQRVSGQYMAEAQRLLDVAQKTGQGRWSPAMTPAVDDNAEDGSQSSSSPLQPSPMQPAAKS